MSVLVDDVDTLANLVLFYIAESRCASTEFVCSSWTGEFSRAVLYRRGSWRMLVQHGADW